MRLKESYLGSLLRAVLNWKMRIKEKKQTKTRMKTKKGVQIRDYEKARPWVLPQPKGDLNWSPKFAHTG